MLGTILTNAADVIILVLLFGATIFIHEFGHFFAAIKLGLVVDVFSIGFGPALWQRKINGVVWKISAFPLGGYVALPQLDPSGMEKIQGENADEDEASADSGASPSSDSTPARVLPDVEPWKRIVVSISGPIGNIIFGFVLAMVIYLSPSAVIYKGAPVVDSVAPGSAAEQAGLQAGDEVLTVNGKRVDTWYSFTMESLLNGYDKPVEVVVLAGREQRQLMLPLVKIGDVPRVAGLTPRPIPCMLQHIDPTGPAGVAGLQPNDIVKRVGETAILSSDDLVPSVSQYLGESVSIVVQRDEGDVTLSVTPLAQPLVIYRVAKGGAAEAAGLQRDDRILTLGEVAIVSGNQFMTEAYRHLGKRVPIRVERAGETLELTLTSGPYGCVLKSIVEGSAAAEAGLQAGDAVISLGGQPIIDPGQFSPLVTENGEAPVDIVVFRNGEELALNVTPRHSAAAGRALIGAMLGEAVGIVLTEDPLKVDVADVIMPWMQEKRPLQQMKSDAMGIFRLLKALVDPKESGNAASGLGGPAAIMATLWIAIKLGLLNAVGFLRFLNINLAILNLLPIPVLDGGHIVFASWEGITRRKVHPKVVAVLVNGFAILLIGVFLLLTVKDVRMIGRWFRPAAGPPAVEQKAAADEPVVAPVTESTP
jgi:regulator of sigma E protease